MEGSSLLNYFICWEHNACDQIYCIFYVTRVVQLAVT